MSLDDPEIVRAEYAAEDGLEARRSISESGEGVDHGRSRPADIGHVCAGTRVTVFVAKQA